MYVCVYDNIHNICNILLSTYTGLKYYIYIYNDRAYIVCRHSCQHMTEISPTARAVI